MKLRELPDVLRWRSRERDAPDGTVTESAAFFRLVLFGGLSITSVFTGAIRLTSPGV